MLANAEEIGILVLVALAAWIGYYVGKHAEDDFEEIGE